MNKNLAMLLSMAFLVSCSNFAFAQYTSDSTKTEKQNKWRISLDAGLGYRLASTKNSKQIFINQGFTTSEVDNYFKKIKWGPKASAQVHYLLNPKYGLGIDYQFHHSSGSITGTIAPGDGSLYYGETEDNVYTNYTGLSLYYNEWILQNKLKYYGQTSIGICFFRQETISFYTPMLITGKSLGTNLELGLEYFIHKHLALGSQLNFFQSTISKINVDNGNSKEDVKLEKDQFEGLSRLDASMGVKFYF